MKQPSTVHSAAYTAAFDADYFTLMGLPRRFEIDIKTLDNAWRQLQSRVHPDRYASGSGAERRVAMQWASRINEAHQVLRNPLLRARYMCELAGHDIQAESNTAMPAAFLAQQIEWREALDEARAGNDMPALDALESQLEDARSALVQRLNTVLHESVADYAAAVRCVREWMFFDRLADEIDHARP